MTVKVTYEIGQVGDLMVDKFDMTLREFCRKWVDGEIDVGKDDRIGRIVKIEVV